MNDDWATVAAILAELPRTDSSLVRSNRVRSRCHRELMRRSRAGAPVAQRPRVQSPLRRLIESTLVGSFCAVYLGVLTVMALRTHGLL